MREQEPDRDRAAGGPAPPDRKRRTGYYQRFAKEDVTATPEALSSPSRYEPRPGQEATKRPSFTDGPEEPGRLRFTPSDELKQSAGNPSHDNRQGKKQARRFADDGRPPEGGKPSRLHFTKEERPPEQGAPEASGDMGGKSEKTGKTTARQQHKTERAEAKAGRANEKLEKARDKLPTRRRPRLRQEADPTTGRLRHRLRFEQEIKPAPTHGGPVSGLAAGAAGTAAYFGNDEGRDNIGVDAAQTTGQTVEQMARQTTYFVERHRAAPYAKVRKLEKQAAKANVNYLYQRSLQDHPELKSSPLSRFQQKQRIKRQYARAAREAGRTAQKAGTTAKETAGLVGNMARAVTSFVGAHKGAVAIGVLVVLVVFFFGSCTSSCSSMLVGGFSSILGTSYGSEDTDIRGANEDYTALENQLQRRIDNIES